MSTEPLFIGLMTILATWLLPIAFYLSGGRGEMLEMLWAMMLTLDVVAGAAFVAIWIWG